MYIHCTHVLCVKQRMHSLNVFHVNFWVDLLKLLARNQNFEDGHSIHEHICL